MRVRERYELAGELRDRYAAAGRSERTEILSSYCLATGYGRKHAIDGLAFRQALKVCWEASGYICSERLQPFLSTLLPLLERHRQLDVEPAKRKMSQTKPGSLLRRQIPVVVGQWKALDQPGYLEIDLVSDSGEIAAGQWIYTLCATDLSTGWTERVAVMGNGQAGVLAALAQVREQLPFACAGCTRMVGPSSSTGSSSPTARRIRSSCPAASPTTRMTTPTSSRRTGRWCDA